MVVAVELSEDEVEEAPARKSARALEKQSAVPVVESFVCVLNAIQELLKLAEGQGFTAYTKKLAPASVAAMLELEVGKVLHLFSRPLNYAESLNAAKGANGGLYNRVSNH